MPNFTVNSVQSSQHQQNLLAETDNTTINNLVTANGRSIKAIKYLCSYDNCGKEFTQNSTLNRHYKTVHLSIITYECDQCSKKISTKCYLQDHKNRHSDQRPYKCYVCDTRFRYKQNLYGHIQTKKHIHNLEKAEKAKYLYDSSVSSSNTSSSEIDSNLKHREASSSTEDNLFVSEQPAKKLTKLEIDIKTSLANNNQQDEPANLSIRYKSAELHQPQEAMKQKRKSVIVYQKKNTKDDSATLQYTNKDLEAANILANMSAIS